MAAFRGSCICGEVAFEVEGPFDLFLNCHCSRCRKATGTAHSCEVIVKASALRWLRGETSVMRFDLPQARSFATAFCKTCGSPMPHLTRSGREAIVPAGGFDEPLGAAPDRHVHWSSRADWYVHGDGLCPIRSRLMVTGLSTITKRSGVSTTRTWRGSELPWRLSWGSRISDTFGPGGGQQDASAAVGGSMRYFPTPCNDIVQNRAVARHGR
jgi:hypothetical protein